MIFVPMFPSFPSLLPSPPFPSLLPSPPLSIPPKALSSLAEAAFENSDGDDDEPQTYCLSPSFAIIIQKLVETIDR